MAAHGATAPQVVGAFHGQSQAGQEPDDEPTAGMMTTDVFYAVAVLGHEVKRTTAHGSRRQVDPPEGLPHVTVGLRQG
jgi:hypothetical protein